MMSLIGTMRKGKIPEGAQRNNSFTLIELLIVSVVILALVALSTPLFRHSFADLELKETVSNISRFITYAQDKAIIDKTLYKIVFDFETNKYRLFAAVGEGQNMRYASPSDRFGRIFYIPKGIDIEGQFNEIFFYPDGHCDNGNPKQPEQVKLKLANKNKKALTITTTGILGNVIIREEKLL